MSRTHPFDMVFAELAKTFFPRIREEAPDTSIDLATLTRLPTAQRLLRDLGSPELAEADPQAITEYLALLFVAYRYWAAGKHTLWVDRDKLEAAIDSESTNVPVVEHDACYLMFPERWYWAKIGDEQPHEPLDGMFVVRAKSQVELTVAAILGLRPGRDGFSQITVTGGADDVAGAASDMRDPPFAPTMDGGAQAGFKSVTTEGELLHLSHLALISAAE